MISRREALTMVGRGSLAGLLVGTAAVVVQCGPTEAPAATAAEADPLLALIREYRAQLAIFNASGDLTDAENDALSAVTMDPPWYRLRDDCPTPTTLEGAIEAVRLVEEELRECGSGGFECAVLAVARAYFDGREAP